MQLQLLVLALESALYPTLLTAVVILLNQPRRVPLLAAYLGGGLTISVGLGLGLVFVLKSSGALHNSRSGLSWSTDLAVGGLALLLAVAIMFTLAEIPMLGLLVNPTARSLREPLDF
jgi:hypothetical protein